MAVLLQSEVEAPPLPLETLKDVADELLHFVGYPDSELSILLVDDERIAQLNASYRGKDKPTNVLSFPMEDEPLPAGNSLPTPHMLGDIVISLDTASQEAESAGLPLRDYLIVLLVHGLVHLLGYDHERGTEAAREMKERERELLQFIHHSKEIAPLTK